MYCTTPTLICVGFLPKTPSPPKSSSSSSHHFYSPKTHSFKKDSHSSSSSSSLFGIGRYSYDSYVLLLSKRSSWFVPSCSSRKSGSSDGGAIRDGNHTSLEEEEEEEEEKEEEEKDEDGFPEENIVIISACLVGLLTGIAVVLFNNLVHEIRDFCWDGIPSRGASWLREEPIERIWQRVILVPTCGGLIVGMLNMIQDALEVSTEGNNMLSKNNVNAALKPILKMVAACFTLGTGNSLGPEGPSVEIGASVAKGLGILLDRGDRRKLSLRAAGSAAGIASGFNAAVAGCFFAVESVLWPSPADPSLSLTNTTSTVILSAVIASVVSEIGLGSEPAFKVPDYDFRSPTELPLYLLLGILCGLVSLSLSWCTSFMVMATENIQKNLGMSKAIFPVLGGLSVGLIALAYPEVLYWGFENVDILLESRPFVKGLSADLLLQLLAVKILATSLCRASGLVGGYYAPSLFIGAATGMAYGKILCSIISELKPIFDLSIVEVASPQAYGLVGMAATLAGVCQVPLTAVLLLFELTQDYRIVLPLLGAVGLSSWITSRQTSKRDRGKAVALQHRISSGISNMNDIESSVPEIGLSTGNLCERPVCLNASDDDTKDLAKRLLVCEAMRTRYVTVLMSTLLTEVVTLMLAEKQSCAMIVDDKNLLIGLLTLEDIQEFSSLSKERIKGSKELIVSEVCSLKGGKCQVSWSLTPSMDLLSAQLIMDTHGTSHLPVIEEHLTNQSGVPIGLLDAECISIACRALLTLDGLR